MAKLQRELGAWGLALTLLWGTDLLTIRYK